jgi:hypothetical protein
MSCTAQSDDWVFEASYQKDSHRKWITRTAQPLTDLRIPERPLITTQDEIQPPDQTDRSKLPRHHLQELIAEMIHQMNVLSDLEHMRLNTVNTPNYNRYPWEWIFILTLCILGIGSVILAAHTKTTTRQNGLEAQLQTLEHRLHLHEEETSPEENGAEN